MAARSENIFFFLDFLNICIIYYRILYFAVHFSIRACCVLISFYIVWKIFFI